MPKFPKTISRLVKHFPPSSIAQIYKHCMRFLLAVFVIIYGFSSYYYFTLIQKSIYQTTKNTFELYNVQTARQLNNVIIFLSEFCTSNTDVTSLSLATESNDIYSLIVQIQHFLSISNITSDIGGMFLYYDSKDIYIPQINGIRSQSYASNSSCSEFIYSLMKECDLADSYKKLNFEKWEIYQVGSDYYLIRFLKKQNIYSGAWINLNNFSSAFDSFDEMEASIFFVNQNGTPVGNINFQNIMFSPEKSLDSSSNFIKSLSKGYFTVSSKLSFCDYYIMALIPTKYLTRQLSPVLRMMLFLIIWLVLLTTVLYYLMKNFFNAPQNILKPAIISLQNGEFDTKISIDYPFLEIQNIIDTFNNMIEEIQNLKINVYEEQLAKKEFELCHLKNQIAPHFLINCLNTIFMLSQDRANLEITQQIIQTLSNHLRYVIANQSYVTLANEVEHTRNYLLLTQLRFPATLSYTLNIEESIMNAKVFPMILLTPTENSIKENLIMGESFQITITGYQYERNETPRIHLIHIDSGSGFPDEILSVYNQINEQSNLGQKGYQVGIYNMVRKLKLTMGETAEITFSNEPKLGARIDIDFPYLPY